MADLEGASGPPPPGLLQSMSRYRRTSLLLVLAFAVLLGGYGYATRSSPTASADLTLTDPRGNSVFRQGNTAAVDLSRYTNQRATFAKADVVLEDAASNLGGTVTSAELRKDVTTEASSTSDIITVTAHAPTEAAAARIRDAVVSAYEHQSQLETDAAANQILTTLNTERDRLQLQLAQFPPGPLTGTQQAAAQTTADSISQVDLQITQARVNAALFGSGVSAIDRLTPTGGGGVSDAVRLAIIGALFGIVVAIAVAWVRADRSPVASEAAFAAQLVGAPVLAAVPRLRGRREIQRLASARQAPLPPYSFAAATMRSIGVIGSVLVVSSRRGEGRTSTALSLGSASAVDGRRVLLIDADRDGARLGALAAADTKSAGVVEVLERRVSMDDAIQTVATHGKGRLDVLTWGNQSNGSPVTLGENSAGELLRAAQDIGYDLVIVDTGPLSSSAEAAVIAGQADNFVAVVSNGTPNQEVEALGQRLHLFPGRLVGTVFTRAAPTGG